jgi:hypothetical protein
MRLPKRIQGYSKTKLYTSVCFILPTLKAVIAVYLEYLGTGPFAQLANYQSNGVAINSIVVCKHHIPFFLFFIQSPYITHRRRWVRDWPGSRCYYRRKSHHTTPTYGVKYFDLNHSKFHFTLCNKEI